MWQLSSSGISPQLEKGRDYRRVNLSRTEHWGIRFLSFCGGYALGYLFYRHMIVAILTGLLLGKVGDQRILEVLVGRQQSLLLKQFQSFLEIWESALVSGENINNALSSALRSLILIYRPDAMIVIEIRQMILWLANGRQLAAVFNEFAYRTDIIAIRNFATIFQVIEGKGEQDRLVIRQTQQLIRETLTIEMEIKTLLTAIQMEQSIMLVIPIIVMIYMSFFGGGIFNNVYQTLSGRLIATIALAIFGGAYYLSRKLSIIRM